MHICTYRVWQKETVGMYLKTLLHVLLGVNFKDIYFMASLEDLITNIEL